MVEYIDIIVSSVIGTILVTAALLAFKREEYAWIPAIILLLPDLWVNVNYMVYPILVDIIVIGNILSLKVLSSSQYRGLDYALMTIVGLVSSYALYVPISSSAVDIASYFGFLLGLFMIISVASYFIIQISTKPENMDAAIKAIVAFIIATVLFFTGSVILLSAYFIGSSPPLFMLGYALALLGVMLEVGAAPMHIWVPDVFTAGDPIPVSVLASTIKIMPIIVLVKLTYPILTSLGGFYVSYTFWLTAIMSALSMLIGNIGALTSREASRVLAYSSVANMGYILAAATALINAPAIAPKSSQILTYALAGLILQLVVNAAGKIGFFTIIKGDYKGSIYSYLLGLSFIGTPPLLGFWSKLFIIISLAYLGPIGLWLAVFLVINSVISIPYYVRLSRDLSLKAPSGMVLYTVALMTAVMLLGVVIPIPALIVSSSKGLLSYLSPPP
ncbi:proton-conducting transporter membrane subunit [Caldivirga maquilingensis]|uniref:NADH/Ubiquinone/plastoquinone (Complex I) n=1 Tax=Caldivirga maquilingensis (strain ATCC 700844 / DSM 13496 / JCM 10307 / IC-167) TaxID=397948 RepID=A8M8N7_CALMQ|nr:proton-conducting transporter membrane subunit [Caldivirga maquilingensis]ABW02106.1 NADH/Ubiquinone/plastoquinone (complex I) [Caldivirga maquilingensis IC-167]